MTTSQPQRLRDLRRDSPPPAELEDRIVQELKARNLIQSTIEGAPNMKMHYGITAAISIAALLVGVVAGQQYDSATPTSTTASAAQYALFLYEDASYRQAEAGREDERVAEYTAWAHELAAAGNLVAGEKLAEDGDLLEPDGTREALVPAATQGALTGYFVISANDLDHARSIAATCPHLRYGGTVSLRRIETT